MGEYNQHPIKRCKFCDLMALPYTRKCSFCGKKRFVHMSKEELFLIT